MEKPTIPEIAIDELSIAESLQENPSSEIVETPKQNPEVDIAEPSQKNPPELPETSQENPPAMDEASSSSESLITIDELSIDKLTIAESSQENQSSEIAEASLKNPPKLPETSQENPPAMDEASSSSESSVTIDEFSIDKPTIPEIAIDELSIAESSQENPSSEIAEASQENPPELQESPQENPLVDDDFYFEIKPARRLKLAMEALCDLEFNPSGKGRIDIDKRGLGITVINPSYIFGHLWLKATGAQNFRCSKPMMGKLVDVQRIWYNLVAADDQDTVTVCHTRGSNDICFIFGEDLPRVFIAEFIEHEEIPVFPEINILCQAGVTVKDLEVLIGNLFNRSGMPEIVIVDIMKNEAMIQVGKERIVLYQYDRMGVDGTTGMVHTDQWHKAKFYWTHPSVLQKTARLFPGFVVSFTSKPPENVMLRFTLQEVGEVMFLKRTSSLVTDLQDSVLH